MVYNMKKINQFVLPQLAKYWGYVYFKIAANENALTQPKFELGITGISG